MANKDYYKTLGVSKSASQAEIKRAYRKLAQKHHPDKGNGNEAKFKEISEAYSVVGDEAKRKQYDQFGFVPGSGGAGPGAGGRGPGGGAYNWQDYSNVNINFEDFGGFGDIFDTFFGGGRKSRTTSQRRGADIEATINIDLADVLSGSEKEITLNKWINCDRCKGEGAEPGFSVKTCPTCKGSGQISKATQTFFGTFAQNQICPECEGAGKIPEKKCTKCAGKGRIRESKRLLVKIPKGVDNGSVIKIVGEGEAAERGGKAGNLYLHVAIKGDNRFVRQGANLLTQINISFIDLATNIESEHSISIVTLPPVVLNKISSSTVTIYNNTDSAVDLSTYSLDVGTTTILSGTIPSFTSQDISLTVGTTSVGLLNNSFIVDSTTFEPLSIAIWQRQSDGLGPWTRINAPMSFDLQSRLSQSKITFTVSGLGTTLANMNYEILYTEGIIPRQIAGTILPHTIDSNGTASRDFFLGTCSSGSCTPASGIGSSFVVTFSGTTKTFILN